MKLQWHLKQLNSSGIMTSKQKRKRREEPPTLFVGKLGM